VTFFFLPLHNMGSRLKFFLMSDPNSPTLTRIYRDELLDKYQIKKDAYAARVKFLGLTSYRDSDNRTYFTTEQVQVMDELHEHIKKIGKMEGFAVTKTDESGALVRANENAIATNDKPAPLATGNIYVEPEEPTAGMDIDRLVREAAELKARNLAMGDLVKLSIAQNMTFEDLDPDLQAKVTAAHNAANPKDTPASIASQLLAQYRSGKKSQNPPA
jgi:hypothetical protein